MTAAKKGSNNGGGRRTKYNQKKHALIVEALRAGNFNETAAAIGGINPSTHYRWLELGEKGSNGKPPAEPYITFAKDCRNASTEAEMRAVGNIEDAGNGVEEIRTEEEWAWKTDKDGKHGKMVLVAKKKTTSTKKDWRASSWLLERREAARWATRNRLAVEHSGEITQTVVLHDGPAPHAEGEDEGV